MGGLKLGIPEAVFRRCSSKYVFLDILQTHRKAPVLESLFNEVKGLKACSLIKKRLQHRCFAAKFVKLLRTHSFTAHLCWHILNCLTLSLSLSIYIYTYTYMLS